MAGPEPLTYSATVVRCPGFGDHGPHVIAAYGPDGGDPAVLLSYDDPVALRRLVVQLAAAAEWLEMEQSRQAM